MSGARDDSRRLQRLEEILSLPESAYAAARGGRELARQRLQDVALDRVRQITAELHATDAATGDPLDALAARLLLNEYYGLVVELRSLAAEAEGRIDAAAGTLDDVRRFLWRDEKIRERARQALGQGE